MNIDRKKTVGPFSMGILATFGIHHSHALKIKILEIPHILRVNKRKPLCIEIGSHDKSPRSRESRGR